MDSQGLKGCGRAPEPHENVHRDQQKADPHRGHLLKPHSLRRICGGLFVPVIAGTGAFVQGQPRNTVTTTAVQALWRFRNRVWSEGRIYAQEIDMEKSDAMGLLALTTHAVVDDDDPGKVMGVLTNTYLNQWSTPGSLPSCLVPLLSLVAVGLKHCCPTFVVPLAALDANPQGSVLYVPLPVSEDVAGGGRVARAHDLDSGKKRNNHKQNTKTTTRRRQR